MTQALTIPNRNGALIEAGQAANRAAARHVFEDYRSRKAANTLKRQDGDLALFARCLEDFGVEAANLATDPLGWCGMTWGLVKAFVKWQLDTGYSVGSINVRLSTVKTYAKLAHQAGALDDTEAALIKSVSGYGHKEGRNIDEKRRRTRVGWKKAGPVSISKKEADTLKAQPDTPQGRRDAVIMALLLDHGLRCEELAALTVEDFSLVGELSFYRRKVDKHQRHTLTADAGKALAAYLEADAFAAGPLLRRSRKDGRLHGAGMKERSITERVKTLGEAIGIQNLSAHDCRHHWATRAARNGTPIDRLKDAGGWSSPAMPLRYVEAAKIANEGVTLG